LLFLIQLDLFVVNIGKSRSNLRSFWLAGIFRADIPEFIDDADGNVKAAIVISVMERWIPSPFPLPLGLNWVLEISSPSSPSSLYQPRTISR